MHYIPHSDADRKAMLEAIGAANVEELFRDIPPELRLQRPLNIPAPLSEIEVEQLMLDLAGTNDDPNRLTCFMGAGVYDHFVPKALASILSRPEFFTAYTPYQAEVSQGTLQAIYEFQSVICRLTGMDVANAGMYDAATASAEAAFILAAHTGRKRVLVAGGLHPHYRQVMTTYCRNAGIELVILPMRNGTVDPADLTAAMDDTAAGLIIQNPNFYGLIESVESFADPIHAKGGLLCVVQDPVSLTLLEAPGKLGADLVLGETQGVGNMMNFGGPLIGYMACRTPLTRRMPGRIVGATEDAEGRLGYVLTLATREQHIRREKATSNICSNEALCALASLVSFSLLGEGGMRKMADLSLQKAHYTADKIAAIPGYKLRFPGRPFFKEFTVDCPRPARELVEILLSENLLAGVPLWRFDQSDTYGLLICVTEKRTREQCDRLVDALARH